MRLSLLLVLALPLVAGAQKRTPETDSAIYYHTQLSELRRAAQDSLERTERYRYLRDRADQLGKDRSDGYYMGITAFIDVAGANYDKLNASTAQSGFGAMPNSAVRLGYGVCYQVDRIMVDVAFFAVGLKNKKVKNDEEIAASFSGFFQFDLGYDLLKPKWINLYPYAGLAYRTSLLKYKKPIQLNSSFTDITNIIVNDQSVKERCNKLGYQAGVGLDMVITEPRPHGNGIILFVKGGTNGILGKEVYDIEGVEYKPGIKYGEWMLSFGVKIFGR